MGEMQQPYKILIIEFYVTDSSPLAFGSELGMTFAVCHSEERRRGDEESVTLGGEDNLLKSQLWATESPIPQGASHLSE